MNRMDSVIAMMDNRNGCSNDFKLKRSKLTSFLRIMKFVSRGFCHTEAAQLPLCLIEDRLKCLGLATCEQNSRQTYTEGKYMYICKSDLTV